MRTLAITGIRVSELEFFTVESVKHGSCTVSNKGKIRSIAIPEKLIDLLLEFCELKKIKEGFVFQGKKPEKMLHETTILRWLKNVAIVANINPDKAFPHNLRHLFAKTYMEKYNNLDELADILGHSRIETTRIYTRTGKEEKSRKINNLDL